MKNLFYALSFIATIVVAGNLNAQNQIDGYVLYHNNVNVPIPEVNVGLYTLNGVFITSSETDDDGYFAFNNVADGSYRLRSATSLDPGGVDMYDAYLILLYILKLYNFTPIQFLAADVNGNGVVNLVDYVYIVVYYFIYGQPFPAGDWVFEEVIVNTASREGNGTVAGSSTGDVQGVWQPTGRDIIDESLLEYDDLLTLMPNETSSFYIRSHSLMSLAAYGLVFDINESAIDVLSVEPYGTNAEYAVIDGQIRIGWVNESIGELSSFDGNLARVTIRAREGAAGNASVMLNNESHIIDGSGEKVGYFELTAPAIKVQPVEQSSLLVYPSPAIDQATIEFVSESTGKARIKIVSLSGQVINSFESIVREGTNKIGLPVNNFATGNYQVIVEDSHNKVYSNRLYVK